ncbi:cell division protein ZapE [Limimaricola pyoseonensis]|uniref:Cell division protein ZapE n=1 Tax=Limimaricola pyoseonensis TaxID=521013 RepID=A0A1G7F1L8_9RHOB|nr:cell division protein ZapE [Limimaricola pyoseonensis]SDE69799.1 cell division protein ZapE [Limimaricola pyoseonensis]
MSIEQAYRARIETGALKPDPAQEAVLPALARVARDLARQPEPQRGGWFRKPKPPEPVKGLYLWGGVGRGKSMLMDLLFDEIDLPKARWHFHAFMQRVHADMKTARARGVDDAIAPVAEGLAGELRFLAFDEMQVTDITDAMIVGRLFEKLFAQGVTVVTTSNRVPDDLYKDGLNRQLFVPFIEQLKARMEVVELASATDHRQGRLRGGESWIMPNDSGARAKLDAIWKELTGAEGGEPLTLQVSGREVVLPEYRNGVARSGFHDLCGRPLGAADYLALADRVQVLMIDGIPRLSRSNFNEAKRFVTLVDALYEAKVRLVASAAAEPAYLYLEGEGSFEFERTASRLEEMQADGWGADAA